MRARLIILCLIGLLILSLAAPSTPYRTERGSIDPVTGSYKQETFIVGRGRTTASVRVSPLEKEMEKLNIPHQRQWQFLHEGYYGWFGGRQGNGCSLGPPIKSFYGDVQEVYLALASEAEVRTLIATLQNGTESEQEAAVAAALDQVLVSQRDD